VAIHRAPPARSHPRLTTFFTAICRTKESGGDVIPGRRATAIGGGLSLLFHAGLPAAVLIRPHLSVTAELTPSTVTIDLQTTVVEERPAPAEPVAPAASRARGTSRSTARRLPRVMTTFASDAPIAAVASADPGDPREEQEGDEPTPPPAPVARIADEPIPPTRAPVIAPDTARALRVYDTYPMILAQASLTRAEVLVEVCVSDHGQVSDAVIAQGGMAAFDHTLRAAIRSWRYRPLVVNGAPTPFCHYMRIKYAMN